jgi:hypothetical protein
VIRFHTSFWPRQVTGQEAVIQDCAVLKRLTPALDPVLRLRMAWRSMHVAHLRPYGGTKTLLK